MDYTFSQEGDVDIFTVTVQKPATFLLSLDVEKRIEKINDQFDRVAKVLIDTSCTVSTSSEVMLLMKEYAYLADIDFELPGYKIAVLYSGNVTSFGTAASENWKKGGAWNKIVATVQGAVQAMDIVGSVIDYSNTPFKDNPHIRFFGDEEQATEWLHSR